MTIGSLVRYLVTLFSFFRRTPLIIMLGTGAITMNTTLLEERLGLIHKRPSYLPTGKHPSPRFALEWRSAKRSTSSSSTSRPTLCTHWSLTANTAPLLWGVTPLLWVVTHGRNWLVLRHPCNPTVTRKGSMFFFCFYNYKSKARIGLLGNNENDCESADSRIGFGTGGTPADDNSCGNQDIRAMGYSLVQWKVTENKRKHMDYLTSWSHGYCTNYFYNESEISHIRILGIGLKLVCNWRESRFWKMIF